MHRACVVAVATIVGHAGSVTGEPRTGLLAPRSLVAVRASGPIRVDGVLDEQAWAAAPIGSQFVQQSPAPGMEATLATQVRVVFDDDALYVGVRLDDPAAAWIEAPIGRRDDENTSDWCFVEIDSRRDRRTAFSLGVNPAGVQVDGVFVDDTIFDSSWNGVWDARASVDARGWTAEYRIPFSVLAFDRPAPGRPMTWGLNVYRFNPHTGETSNWSPRTPQLAGVVSLFNDLVIDARPHARRLDVTPYASVSSSDGPHAGIDAEVALGSNVTLVGSVLPDFGQVEVDPAQLNLTAFELFLPERRPLFTEGLDAFQFGTALPLVSRGDSFSDEAAFYSRRIGRAPDGAAPPGTTAPSATTIAAAAKLFGRSDGGWRVGALATSTLAAHASEGTVVAVPEQAAIVRVVKESGDAERAAGVFASELHRDGELGLPRDSAALGVDGRARWDDQRYEVRGWVLASALHGSEAAIAAVAEQPRHLLDRVDAPRLRLADGATSMTGAAGELRVAKVGGHLLGSLAVRTISPQFDDDALGFQRNADYVVVAAQLVRKWQPNSSWLHSWSVGTNDTGVGWSWGGERRVAVVDAFASAVFANYADAAVTLQHEPSILATEWLRGGPALRLPARETIKLSAHSDTRARTVAGIGATVALEPGSGSRDLAASVSLAWRLSDHVAGTLAANYDDQYIGWQYVAATPASYLVARVHQRTAALALQVDLAVSSHMIVQLYAQPFVTIGTYDRYAEVVDAHTDAFADADVDALGIARPDASVRSLIASAIARWEIRPGSFLTAVWNHHGDASGPVASLGSELVRVIHESGSDVALVKLAWRFAL